MSNISESGVKYRIFILDGDKCQFGKLGFVAAVNDIVDCIDLIFGECDLERGVVGTEKMFRLFWITRMIIHFCIQSVIAGIIERQITNR